MNLTPSNSETITSLELVKQINLFRSQEENKSELRHDTLLSVIRDEFEEEIGLQKLLETLYTHPQNGQRYPMFVLTISQAKQVLVRESKLVRKLTIAYLEKLENQVNFIDFSNPNIVLKIVENWKEESEKRQALEQQIEKDKPKTLFADSVSASSTSILIGELAKILKQNGIDIGQNRLFDWLRGNGYLISRYGTDYNMPTQKAMNLKLFTIKETSITHADGHISISKTTKVTGDGQIYFVNKFLNKSLKIA